MIRVAGLLLLLASRVWAAPTQGYVQRNCGYDFGNQNGTPGEAGDCNVCDGGVHDDVDGNGANGGIDPQVYVDCSAGTDTTGCGAPGSPCHTIGWAMARSNTTAAAKNKLLATAPASTIQAICFKNTCNEVVANSITSATGTYTIAATGSQHLPFLYPRYPLVISGWKGGDGKYPPASASWNAILDGTNIKGHYAFEAAAVNSYEEIAHFQPKNWNTTCGAFCVAGSAIGQACTVDADCPSGGTDSCSSRGGIMKVVNPTNTTASLYVHDLDGDAINPGCQTGAAAAGGTCLAQINGADRIAFRVYSPTLNDFAIVNSRFTNVGAYFMRGAPQGGGHLRVQNVSLTHKSCHGSGATGVLAGAKIWGDINGIEVLDNLWDAAPAAWGADAASRSGKALVFGQASQDWWVVNNSFTDYDTSLYFQPSASGFNMDRNVKNVTIDQNTIRETYQGYGNVGVEGIDFAISECLCVSAGNPQGSGGTCTLKDQQDTCGAGNTCRCPVIEGVTITNNFISGTAPTYQTCINAALESPATSGQTYPGTVTIIGNTCDISSGRSGWGTIMAASETGELVSHGGTYVIKNNLVKQAASNSNPAVYFAYKPDALAMDFNTYDHPGTNVFKWKTNAATSLATFITQASSDGFTIEGSGIEASLTTGTPFVNVATGNYRLTGGEIARTNGTDTHSVLVGLTDHDLDGNARCLGANCDRGGSEVGAAAVTTTTQSSTTTSSSNSSTSSTSTTTSTSSTSSTIAGITPASLVQCGNFVAAPSPPPTGSSAYWAGNFSGVRCVTGNAARYQVVDLRLWATVLAASNNTAKIAVYAEDPVNGGPTGAALCSVSSFAVIPNAWSTSAPAGCVLKGVGAAYHLVFILGHSDIQLGDLNATACSTDISTPNPTSGRFTNTPNGIADAFPASISLPLQDGCREIVVATLAELVQPYSGTRVGPGVSIR